MNTIAQPTSLMLAVACRAAATIVLLTPGLILGSEGDHLRPQDQSGQAARSQPAAFSVLAAQARRHPSYQVFAHHLTLPAITVVEKTTLAVGGQVKIDVTRPDQMTHELRETLASQFDVPLSIIDKFAEHLASSETPDAERAAQELRSTVIDYKYLVEKWTQYLPPAGADKIRTQALQALCAGEINKAWEMYLDLSRPPQPPTGLHIVGQG